MPPEQELAYYQLARQHRFLPLVYGYRPKLKLNGPNVSLDWTEYDCPCPLPGRICFHFLARLLGSGAMAYRWTT